jgi:hypothetical protein
MEMAEWVLNDLFDFGKTDGARKSSLNNHGLLNRSLLIHMMDM